MTIRKPSVIGPRAIPRVPAELKKPKAFPLTLLETRLLIALSPAGWNRLEEIEKKEIKNMSRGTLFTCDMKIPATAEIIRPAAIIRI